MCILWRVEEDCVISEISTYQTTPRHFSEDFIFHPHHRDSLKSRKIIHAYSITVYEFVEDYYIFASH
jgi:hypothetical protein